MHKSCPRVVRSSVFQSYSLSVAHSIGPSVQSMPLQFVKPKSMRLRSYSVSPKVVSRSATRVMSSSSPISSLRNLPPQTPPESAADTLVEESLPVQGLFENENFSANDSVSIADMSDDSWQLAQGRRTARSTRQSSRASRRKLETTSAESDADVMTCIPFSSASVAETSTVDSQSSSISLDACLSTDIDTFSASLEAPDDVTMTDMQRRYIAHTTLMARFCHRSSWRFDHVSLVINFVQSQDLMKSPSRQNLQAVLRVPQELLRG